MYSEIKKALSDEIKYYSDKDNNDWAKEKNEGFKEGIKYCYDLVINMDRAERYIPTQMTSTSCVGFDVPATNLNSPGKPPRQY
jgi:hypothetical protein